MKKSIVYLSMCVLWVLSLPAWADATPLSTGSGDLDVILQWLTSIITVASLVANFTPTPVDNAGVRVLSLVVNLAAANWKQVSGAWSDRNKIGAVGWLAPALLAAMLSTGSGRVDAAACAPLAGAGCPAGTLCLGIEPATTRKDGSLLPASEIKNYELWVGSVVLPLLAPNQLTINYSVPAGTTLGTDVVVSGWTIDTDGLRSETASTCTNPVAITVKKPPPLAPGLRVRQAS